MELYAIGGEPCIGVGRRTGFGGLQGDCRPHRIAATASSGRRRQLLGTADLSRRIELAAAAADFADGSIERIEPEHARRIGETNYREVPTQVRLRRVTLQQVFTFLHALSATPPTADHNQQSILSVSDIRLSAPCGEETGDRWTVESTLTYTVYVAEGQGRFDRRIISRRSGKVAVRFMRFGIASIVSIVPIMAMLGGCAASAKKNPDAYETMSKDPRRDADLAHRKLPCRGVFDKGDYDGAETALKAGGRGYHAAGRPTTISARSTSTRKSFIWRRGNFNMQ